MSLEMLQFCPGFFLQIGFVVVGIKGARGITSLCQILGCFFIFALICLSFGM